MINRGQIIEESKNNSKNMKKSLDEKNYIKKTKIPFFNRKLIFVFLNFK